MKARYGIGLLAVAVVAAVLALSVGGTSRTNEIRLVSGTAQGTTYRLQWVGGGSEESIGAAADRELARLDELLSNYRTDSVLERFNAARTTEALDLPSELIALLETAKQVHAASDGCFDPTVRPLVRAWGFDTDNPAVPNAARLAAARVPVGLDKLVLESDMRVRKLHPALEIDMASIGQGYSAGRLAELLEQQGSSNYLAEIGGEIVARGSKPDGNPWKVGAEDPTVLDAVAASLSIPPDVRTAVITSGSYRHYLESDGRRLSHVIDPRTALPIDHDLVSVTVLGEDAAATAAWATALLCLGTEPARAAAARRNVVALLWTAHGTAPAMFETTAAFDSSPWRSALDPSEPAAALEVPER